MSFSLPALPFASLLPINLQLTADPPACITTKQRWRDPASEHHDSGDRSRGRFRARHARQQDIIVLACVPNIWPSVAAAFTSCTEIVVEILSPSLLGLDDA